MQKITFFVYANFSMLGMLVPMSPLIIRLQRFAICLTNVVSIFELVSLKQKMSSCSDCIPCSLTTEEKGANKCPREKLDFNVYHNIHNYINYL
jgi:hypothetical protein